MGKDRSCRQAQERVLISLPRSRPSRGSGSETGEPEPRRDASSPDETYIRSFGRRRSRKLTDRQKTLLEQGLGDMALDLSEPAPTSLTKLFPRSIDAVWLEIGFGGGEHLLWQAEHNPNVGFIACEPFIDGVVKVIDGAGRRGLDNILVFTDDARQVLDWLPPAAIARAFVLFPDPWPKARHHKRRLVQADFIASLARVMTAESELRLATDINDYARQMLLAVGAEKSFRWTARAPTDWRDRPADWPATRYEAKAIREGRKRYFLRFAHRG